MTNWSFRYALEELKAKCHFDESVLKSTIGLRLGDIRFTELQTTIKMHALCASACFCDMSKRGPSMKTICPWMAIVIPQLYFLPSSLTSTWRTLSALGIGSIIQRRRSPLGDISSFNMVIKSIHSILNTERKKSLLKCRTYMMLIGNYGGHMAFATDPPYCVAYTADYKNTTDPSKMTPHEPLNHAYTMVSSNMVVRRLLSLPNWEPVERKLTTSGRLLILTGCAV